MQTWNFKTLWSIQLCNCKTCSALYQANSLHPIFLLKPSLFVVVTLVQTCKITTAICRNCWQLGWLVESAILWWLVIDELLNSLPRHAVALLEKTLYDNIFCFTYSNMQQISKRQESVFNEIRITKLEFIWYWTLFKYQGIKFRNSLSANLRNCFF